MKPNLNKKFVTLLSHMSVRLQNPSCVTHFVADITKKTNVKTLLRTIRDNSVTLTLILFLEHNSIFNSKPLNYAR